MINALEERKYLEKLVKDINDFKEEQDYQKLSEKVEALVNFYIKEKINDRIRNHIESYVENYIIKSDQRLELEEGQTEIRVGKEYIRRGAWRDGNEEDIDLNYFHYHVSKYVDGFTCGNLKYEFDYPYQVIETVDTTPCQRGYKIYRYTESMTEKIEITTTAIAENLFELRKKQTIYSGQEEMKEKEKVLFYEETPFVNIEISPQKEKTKRINK